MFLVWFFVTCLIEKVEPSLVEHGAAFSPDYVLEVAQTVLPLGCRYRLSTAVNGTAPGPALTVKENQTTWVRVYNKIPDQNLTMHWHGLSQSVAPFSDGTPRASQWPIPPLHFFDYEIHPHVGEAGTYFYHSHVDFQAVTAAGPLIVEEASSQSPYRFDEEKIIFLSELYNKTEDALIKGVTADSNNSFFWTGETEAILVNGNAANSSNAEQSGACGTGIAVGPACNDTIFSQNTYSSPCSPAIIDVEPDRVYRLRVIGGTALSLVTFGFEYHNNLTVIAADGSYTLPLSVEYVQAGPGQRYDFLMRTKALEELQRLNRTMFLIQLETRQRPSNVTNFAILRYNLGTDPTSDPLSFARPSHRPLHLPDDVWNWPAETKLTPLNPVDDFPSAKEVTRRIYLSNHQISSQSTGVHWSVSGNLWYEMSTNPTPYLVSVYEKGEAAIPSLDRAIVNGGWDPAFNAYPVEIGEIIEIVIVNENDGLPGGLDSHPWHVHGQHVYDLGAGSGSYEPDANEARLRANDIVPAKRDTTYVWKYTDGDDLQLPDETKIAWRAWRLRVENAGIWMIHCHILQHMVMGMQSVWVVGNASEIVGKGLDESTEYLAYGGSVYGNDTYHPTVRHFWADGQCCQD